MVNPESLQKTDDRKVMPLKESITKYITPGDVLHFPFCRSRPNAAIYELIRQFYGTSPRFTFVSTGIVTNSALLVHCGLIERLITSYYGDNYPNPSPNAVINRALAEGSVILENWSLWTIILRLKAAAYGTGFLPTHSLIDSDMAVSNSNSFKVIQNPFDENRQIGLVRELIPDISFVHGIVADASGNIVLCPPYGDGILGALAAQRGVIATVEKIVSTDTIRQFGAYQKIPSYVVLSVSEAPLGAHPEGMYNLNIPGVMGYADDDEFISELRQVSKDSSSLDSWVKEWVTSQNDYFSYVDRLGKDRIENLYSKANGSGWQKETVKQKQECSKKDNLPPTSSEWMIVAASRMINKKVKKENYQTLLAGAGTANLASWLAYNCLKEEGYEIDLMTEMGFFGMDPKPGDPYLFSYQNIPTCKLLADTELVLNLFTGGQNNRCLGCLSTGQVDQRGNLNSTVIPGKGSLTGSGGANDVTAACREVILILRQSKNKFIDSVPYITCPGKRVRNVVSDLGIFQKNNEDELVLIAWFENDLLMDEARAVRQIRARCGWDLIIAPDLEKISIPSPEELKLLRAYDPERLFLK